MGLSLDAVDARQQMLLNSPSSSSSSSFLLGRDANELLLMEEMSNMDELALMNSHLNKKQHMNPGFLVKDFMILAMSIPAFTWLLDNGPLSPMKWASNLSFIDEITSKSFTLLKLDSFYAEVIGKSAALQRYIQCALEVIAIITIMLSFCHFAASAAIGSGEGYELNEGGEDDDGGGGDKKRGRTNQGKSTTFLSKCYRLTQHTIKLFWDVLFLSTLLTFTAFTLSALTRGNNKVGVGLVVVDEEMIFSVEFAESAVASARLWAPRFVAVNSAFMLATRALKDFGS
jgi:hypothetical protein